jgi:hypothetical protein
MTGGKVTTFADLEKDLNSREQQSQQQQQAAETTTTQTEPQPPAAIIQPENGQQAATETQAPVVVDNTVSQFDISLGEEGEQHPQQPAQSQQPTYDWKEEIKKIPIEQVAAVLEFDPFAVELNKHIKGGGQPLDYLQARAIDYNKLSDDSLLKDDLRNQYPTFTPQQIDLMFDRKYGVTEDALEEDKEFAKLQLQADAYKVRQSKITEQQRFKISETPTPQKDEAYEQWKQNRELQSQQIEKLTNYYSNHEATKKLNESKRVTISLGDGVAPFNWNINQPELITKVFTDDGSSWQKITSTPQGEPDVAKQQLIALFSYNPQKFINDVFNYGKSMGVQKELVEEGQNAQRPQAIVTNMTNTNGKAVPTGVAKFGDKAR